MSRQPRPSSHHAPRRGGPLNRAQPLELLEGIAVGPAWPDRPACHVPGKHGVGAIHWSHDPQDKRDAIDLCHQCPIRRECAQIALAAGEREGIWSGIELDPHHPSSNRELLEQVIA